VCHRQRLLDAGDDLARRMIEADVKGEEVVDVVEIAALGHRLPAAGDLLGGLEEHRQRSVERSL